MKKKLFVCLLVFLLAASGVLAQGEAEESDDEPVPGQNVETTNVTYVSPKKVLLSAGSIQKITAGKKSLIVEYKGMHKTGHFPIIRIQGIPFKLPNKGDRIQFTWSKAGYELLWQGKDDKVIFMSSEDFARQSFSVENKDVKSSVIYKGLVVETKRSDGQVCKLEVVDVVKDSNGRMEKFSVRTYADEKDLTVFHNENNILAPEFHKQYEKGINDEVLFIFTTNEKGEIVVYYR